MGLGPIAVARNPFGLFPGENVVRCIEGGVDPAAPWVFACLRHTRQVEIQRLLIGVKD